ncbi:serine hydroxymethyltransferase [Patescibacteria group bacterium]|nr:serine hydroxymethyltransferase [Patescibacteria group bacterium]
MKNLSQQDPQVAEAIKSEIKRQREGLELIPSENFVSLAVLEALGSVLTNKYAEGYPGKRYYGGTANVDTTEQLAIDRAKQLFGAEHVNVQPLSGAPANVAVYSAVLEPGDTVLGMDLSHGGHLTHGHPITWMAKIFNFVRYQTKANGQIDYDQVRQLALEHKPKIVLCGYSAYSRDLDYQKFKEIADEVGALTMADVAHIAGLIAAKEMNDPVPYFDIITTTTHKTLRGPRGGMIMCKEKLAAQIDKAVFPGFQGGPHQHNIAAKAVAFAEDLQPEYKEYIKQVKKNAKMLSDTLRGEGFTICFGGTENHLVLTDVTPLGVAGKQAQALLDEVNITCNKNMIPDDTRKPLNPSGIRLGSPALTTRGFQEEDMKIVGQLIAKILKNPDNEKVKKEVLNTVKELTDKYPLYPELNI